jgi:predicted ATPase/class 3 adenylate cyclase
MTEAATTSAGTATFLFTDIEGSTRLEQSIGTVRYGALRERHRELLRAAFAAAGGTEESTEGDSFFVVFDNARAAVSAAVAAQRAIVAQPWDGDAEFRVRMGIHSGEAFRVGGSLVGLDINRAARIASAAHGGQILISDATRALTTASLPTDVRLRELGTFRLRDLTEPEPLAQVDVEGLPTAFPPPRTAESRPTHLPGQLTTFVGRQEELTQAEALLQTTRLLTFTGPGGTGKTRLSIALATQVADRFPDGVFFVPLEPVRDPLLISARIAASIGVTERAAQPVAEAVPEWLASRRVLLVLDNFEQVLDGAPVVAELLRAAPDLKIIATSRAALHVSGEQEYPVDGLPVPPDPGALSSVERMNLPGGLRDIDAVAVGQYAAVRLFIERAKLVRPSFAVTNENAPAVAAIAARLHGMPLAIELAAARVKLLSPDAILTRLEHQLDVLSSGGRDLPARQQTLRGAIAWSYDILDEGSRRLLDRLSVFAGSADVEAAEAVLGPASELGVDVVDGLSALAEQSLVRIDQTPEGEPRFGLLESIHEFAAEQLAARGERDAVVDRHRDWFLAFAEKAAPELAGEEQRSWLDRLELAHDDLRAVLDRTAARPEPSVAIPLAFAMWRFWQKHGHLAEARLRLEAMDAAPWSRDDPRLRARLLEALGGICWWQGDLPRMQVAYTEALEIWKDLGDDREIANAYYNLSFSYAVGENGPFQGSDADHIGEGYLEAALAAFRQIGDHRGEANALWGLGTLRYFQGSETGGEAEFRAALQLFRGEDDRTMEAWALHMLGSALIRQRRTEEARDAVAHAIRHFHAAGDIAGLTLTLFDLASVAVQLDDLPRAARLRGAARNLTTETGTGLATFTETAFEQAGLRPNVLQYMPIDEAERLGAEGAAMTLDDAVAYSLEGANAAPTDLDEH